MKKEEVKRRQFLVKKLAIYTVFFVLIVAMILVTGTNKKVKYESNTTTTTTKVLTKTYMDKQRIVLEGDYSCTIAITGTKNVVYRFKKTDNTINGVKEDNSKNIEYKIEDNKTYIKENGIKKEIDSLYTEDELEILDFKKLFDKLNSRSTIIKRNGNISTYDYSIDNQKIKVTTDENNINKIEIDGQIKYDINFTY